MIRPSLLLALFCAVLFSGRHSAAQGTKADYERSSRIRESHSRVFKLNIDPHWVDDDSFWYRNQLQDGKQEFVRVDIRQGKRVSAFDVTKLAACLSAKTGKPMEPHKMPVFNIRWTDDAKTIDVDVAGKTWRIQLGDAYQAEAIDRLPRPDKTKYQFPDATPQQFAKRHAVSPDMKWEVLAREHNLYLRNKDTNEEQQLTRDGNAKDFYDAGVFWSPDSSRFVAMRTQPEQEHRVFFVESAPKDQLQPKLHSHQYIKPGDRIRQSKPHLFHVATKKQVTIDENLFSNPWSIDKLRWMDDGRRFTFVYNQRGHQVLRIVVVDAETGESAALVDETSKTFVDYAYKQYTHYLDGTNELIWMSERNGWNHLYLFDSRTGNVKNQITKGDWVVRKVVHVDANSRQVWFEASGIYPEQDPYFRHLCRIDLDGSNFTVLTAGNGTHTWKLSPKRNYFIDTYSRVDMPPKHEVRDANTGKLLVKLDQADWTVLQQSGWQTPVRFKSKARDGKTDIYGIILRPSNFDPKKKYPVIEKIYAGPHGSFVPKAFSPSFGGQYIAELGFVVVQIDGLGTSNRSKAFHDVCWKNLGDSGFPDRIKWMKAAAQKYPYMDLSKVGIYGGSAGGQSSTRAMLAHGDFYKVAVSDCGCHDNRMDKIWWNELWMGWPIGPHYAEQSNVTQAKNLTGKLLLIVGELDRNVDPASTMQVVDALVKADKDFDMLVIPGAGHGAAESKYGKRRRADYFVRHLLGVEPRAN